MRTSGPFLCPECNGPTRVTNVYISPRHSGRMRRRLCKTCSKAFTTREALIGEDLFKIRNIEEKVKTLLEELLRL